MQQKMILKNVLLSKDAFTLLEVLMGLFVVSVISLLMLQITILTSITNQDIEDERQLALFLMNISNELALSKSIDVNNQTLVIKPLDYSDDIIYKYKNNKIIRTRNDKGSETVISGVKNAKFVKKNKKIFLDITFKNNKDYMIYVR